HHTDGVLLKVEILGDRFCRLQGLYRDEPMMRALLEGVYDHKYVHEDNQTHIYLIQSGLGGLHTERVEITPPDIDVTLHYNDDFPPVHERLVSLLQTPKSKGLVLLHGEPGTGKTTYIKLLSSLVKKDMLILPPYMTNFLTAPEFIPFLLDHRESVLIIEDAERILQSREAGGDTNSVSNILNLTDGLLADCMHIQVIATFNASKSLLDKALLRKGRLMVDYAFGKLARDKANKLLETLGYDYRTTLAMTLADIFNLEDQTVSGDRGDVAKVGF
ncbi:MAG: AAA family ATPase, partial [Gemmataceae bacterium]